MGKRVKVIGTARDATAFRHIVVAVEAVHEAEADLIEAVRAARDVGDSWNVIAVALGVSVEEAQERFGESTD